MLNIDWIDNTEENLRTMYKDYVEQIEKDGLDVIEGCYPQYFGNKKRKEKSRKLNLLFFIFT